MQKKKVAIIGTVGLPARYGGFETLAEHLVNELSSEMDFTVYCTKKHYTKDNRPKTYKGARLKYLPFSANGIQSIVYDTISILHALFYADVLLVLGVSGGFLLPFVKLFTNKKIIVSIDGIEWKRNKWSKIARWYLWAAEWVAVRFSHADIADNESIQDYTAIRYKTLSQIIEYGADHILKVKPTAADKVQYPFLNRPYAFTVCRIEPENNIHVILEAFKQLDKHTMVMVGNWKNSPYGLQLLEQYKDCANIMMLDPIYDQRNLDMLRGNCTLYVHGHSAGGTNPSLVEAMYLGLPIFAYNVSYNRTTTEGKAKYFRHASELASLVQNTRIAELNELATCMKTISNRRYTWKVIASRYRYLIMQVSKSSVKNKLGQSNIAQSFSDNYIIANGMGHFLNQQHFYEKR
jgi:glycosyltransferase involved in cell wall biosynthesis